MCPVAERVRPAGRRPSVRAVARTRWGPALAGVVLLAACVGSDRPGPPHGVRADPPAPATASPASSPPSPRPSPSPRPRAFTLVATGDVLVHGPVAGRARASAADLAQSFDFGPMLAEVAPAIEAADLAVCHLETPLAPDNRGLSGYPVFNAPNEVADALAASGYDTCSTASNHSLDQGPEGVVGTLDVLEAAGLGHAGTARRAREAGPALLEVPAGPAAVTVAHLSYTYGLNGLSLPGGRPYLVNLIDPDRILADARRARQAGAEFVVVSLHWGSEYRHEPTPRQQTLAGRLLRADGIDLIIGHHAHVVQPLDRIGTGYVAYGLGNFLSAQGAHCCPAATRDGVVLRFSVREQPTGGFAIRHVAFAPTWVQPATYRVLPTHPRARSPDTSRARSPDTPRAPRRALLRSLRRTTDSLLSLGVAAELLEPPPPHPTRATPIPRRAF